LQHWLDDSGRLSLTGPFNQDIPEYAILSHTWGLDGEEVTYEDSTELTEAIPNLLDRALDFHHQITLVFYLFIYFSGKTLARSIKLAS
jgi:hypothetical protein